jgi:endonuclease-3
VPPDLIRVVSLVLVTRRQDGARTILREQAALHLRVSPPLLLRGNRSLINPLGHHLPADTHELHGNITQRLVRHGRELYALEKKPVAFTGEDGADDLLNDLENYPHAFVIACIMDRQIKAERAWLIPFRFKQVLGSFEFTALEGLTLEEIRNMMVRPKPLHRFPVEMSNNFLRAVDVIRTKYDGDASRIWTGYPPSAEVVYRFLEFRGVGMKIASMAANILARDFKVRFSDYYSIEISADVHVKRVFGRLGLTAADATVEQVVYRARSVYPEFPGLLDLPAWEIGRQWCRPVFPRCKECYMNNICPTVTAQ